MSPIQDQYEAIRYPHFVHPLADPARMAAIASILGMTPARPNGARVLDIGCGAGSHLLALAARSPDSTFVGIDFSGPDIQSAQALAAEAGLGNVRFEQADLMAWVPPTGCFDYVIAYGFFSWVPDDVKARLLEVVAASLAPQGVACISYLTYPGCKQQDALRDLLRLRTEGLERPEEQVTVARATLDFLDRAWERTPKLPHAAFLRDTVSRIRRKADHSLLLDDLGVERDPCYLLQFAGWAGEHGLRYLGDSEFHTMLLENLPPASAQELAALGLDRLQTEQMIDYVSHRAFRCTLLVGRDAIVATGLVASALRDLSFGPVLFPARKPHKGVAIEAKFQNAEGASATLRSLPLVAFAQVLAAHRGALVSYAELSAEAEALSGTRFTPEQHAQLCEDLLVLYGRRQVILSTLSFRPAGSSPEMPRLTPFNAAHARRRAMLVSASHEAIALTPADQAVCTLLDGSHSVAEIAKAADRTVALVPFLEALNRLGCLLAD